MTAMGRIGAMAAAAVIWAAGAVGAQALDSREGWAVHASVKSYAQLLSDLKGAVKAQKMGLVTEAGPTEAAKKNSAK